MVKVKKDADVDKILSALYKYTDLECTFGINMVAIADGKPQQLGLLDIIKHYVVYQREVVLRRTKFDLAQAKERCHILEGLIIAVRNIDEVIQIIKTSESVPAARQRLRERFELSERQAQAILDLRLARLTKLEIYQTRTGTGRTEKAHCQTDRHRREQKTADGCGKRGTQGAEKAVSNRESKSSLVFDVADIKVEKFDDVRRRQRNACCAIRRTTSIKVVTEKNFNMSDKNLGERSAVIGRAETAAAYVRRTRIIYSFTNMGNCYKIDFEDVIEPGKLKDKGMNYAEQSCPDAQEGEKPIAFLRSRAKRCPRACLLFYSRLGYVKKSDWKEYNILKYAFQAVQGQRGRRDHRHRDGRPRTDDDAVLSSRRGACA